MGSKEGVEAIVQPIQPPIPRRTGKATETITWTAVRKVPPGKMKDPKYRIPATITPITIRAPRTLSVSDPSTLSIPVGLLTFDLQDSVFGAPRAFMGDGSGM